MVAVLDQYLESVVAEQATGCAGAGSYREWAKSQGYQYLEVYDWTSSAGDWIFVVSENGEAWYPAYQENNWPGAGFTRGVDRDIVFYGTALDALAEMEAYYN